MGGPRATISGQAQTRRFFFLLVGARKMVSDLILLEVSWLLLLANIQKIKARRNGLCFVVVVVVVVVVVYSQEEKRNSCISQK